MRTISNIYWLGIKGFLLSKSPGHDRTPATVPSKVVDETRDLLIKAMEVHQLYLQPDLTLQALANHIGVSPRTVSMVLNQNLSKSFTTFVNTYRIEAFRQKVKAAGAERLTIAGVAMECGFSSKATFQRVYKEMTGQLPSELRSTI